MRRRSLLLLLALAWAAPAHAAVAFVQATSGGLTVATASIAKAFGAPVGNGNAVAGVCGYESTRTLSTVTDDKVNSYTIQRTVTDATNGERASVFYKNNITNAPTTITCNLTGGTSANGVIVLIEGSGIDTSGTPLDGEIGQLQATPGTGANGVTSTAVTTTAAGDWIVGFAVDTGNFRTGTQFAAGTGFTERTEFGNTGGFSLDGTAEERTQVAAGSIAATFTATVSEATLSFVITFKASGAAAPTAKRLLTLGAG